MLLGRLQQLHNRVEDKLATEVAKLAVGWAGFVPGQASRPCHGMRCQRSQRRFDTVYEVADEQHAEVTSCTDQQ